MKIVFMGTPDFAKISLEALYNAGHNIELVVTNPDRPKGRGMKLVPSPVKEYAISKNLEIIQPEKIKNNNSVIEKIKNLKPDIICVVAYGKILPKELLELAKFGAINVHGSLLPKYRGAAPIQWAIINGDKKTGITIMYMDEGLDTGDIISMQETEILPNETLGELWERLAVMGANLLVNTLELMNKEGVNRVKQGTEATYAPMLTKDMAKIDWENKTAKEIKDLVRGLNPILGAYTFLNGKKIKLWKVDMVNVTDFITQFPEFKEYEYRFKNIQPGTVLYVNDKKGLYVKTKDEILSIIELQAENAKKMSINDFLRGNRIQAVDIFE